MTGKVSGYIKKLELRFFLKEEKFRTWTLLTDSFMLKFLFNLYASYPRTQNILYREKCIIYRITIIGSPWPVGFDSIEAWCSCLIYLHYLLDFFEKECCFFWDPLNKFFPVKPPQSIHIIPLHTENLVSWEK